MDLRQLVRAFDAGRIDADTLVWRKGMPDWRRLRDVSELAERLIGGGSEGNTAKLPSEPPVEAPGLASRSEPPPRQAERSRTPPASYTVGARSGSEPPNTASPPTSPGVGSSSSAPPPVVEVSARERTSVAPGGEAVQASGAAPRTTLASDAPRPQSRRSRGKPASSPKAVVPSRVITQPGFESPAAAAARNATGASHDEQAMAGAPSQANGVAGHAGEGVEANRSSAAPAAATGSGNRQARATTPPGGVRRPSSSDETPAQKPSSVSLPPGAIATISARPRGRRMLALAAVVLGAVILIRQLSTSTDGAASTAQHRVDSASERRVDEVRAASAAESHSGSAPSAARATAATTVSPRSEVPPPAAPPVGMTVEASTNEDVAVSGAAREALGAKDRTAPAAVAPTPAPKAAPPPPAAASAAPRPAPAMPVKAAAPRAPVAAAPVAPRPAATPSDAVASAPRAPRPFDETLATEQFEVAASKARACGQAGPTRGSGRVRVVIQPWGRVGRVTHLNPDFAGTEVGECVMQAFLQIQLPPFDGNTRSIAGDFVIQ
jgi:hypothetical protein